MSDNQFENEIMYMLSKEILKRMFLRKLITEEEYKKIDTEENVNKEQIENIAKKIKLNTIYFLKGRD